MITRDLCSLALKVLCGIVATVLTFCLLFQVDQPVVAQSSDVPSSSEPERAGAKPISGADTGMVEIDGFRIDRYEYPNRVEEYPMVNVSWYEAQAICASEGKRLCTEREWEKACRGQENYIYPYGNEFDQDKCDTGYKKDKIWRHDRGTSKIGSWRDCVSGYGVYDMSGNVWEWVDGWYFSKRRWRVVRGGSWFQSVNLARCDTRYGYFLEPEYKLDLIGFRCCQDVTKKGKLRL